MPASEPTPRDIPAVDRILQSSGLQRLLERYPRPAVRQAVQAELDRMRRQILSGELASAELADRIAAIDGRVERLLANRFAPSLRRLVNATGIVIHTNAGRAPLSEAAARAVAEVASGYSNLEYDLEAGRRGHRDRHFEGRMARLMECEAATVCNNNAAAVFLILNTLARGKKVLVSRGELVEIGGSFRIPDILERSGASLREVGTTNKTRVSDYRQALDDQVALILKVHPSNYRIVGFTASPTPEELVSLSLETGVPVVHDVGSGLLFPSPLACLREEPVVAESLRAGIDLVCFSGDKLLGGPQAGLILGKKRFIDPIRRNPLMRVLRLDKMAYAALERTLIEYEEGRHETAIPVRRMLATGLEELAARVETLGRQLEGFGFQVAIVPGHSLAGGGSAPEERIETRLIALSLEATSADELESRLRSNDPPILARIEEDRLLLDLRTVLEGEEQTILAALQRIQSV